jgi:uncharacterized membrane protein YqjE
MPTLGTDEIRRPADANGRGVGTAVKDVADHAKRVISLEIELAKLELTRKVASLGLGIVLGVVAALFGVFALGFLFATVAAGFATFLDTWLALLVTALILLLLAGILGLLAVGRIKRATPPVPEQALAEHAKTMEAIRSDA